ncbi:MAG: hypothetical protein JW774_01230 [Candidatus Aureabacteria bacterium]|nr:hypothetical protein [Candidatus Auribacterota bacterium]
MAAKLQKREIVWLLILSLVVGGSWFNKNQYAPRKKKIRALRATRELLNSKISKLEQENVVLSKKEDELKAYDTEITRQRDELQNLEASIPKRQELDRLLYYLTHGRKGIEFESIKPLENREKKTPGENETPSVGYRAQNYEIICSGTYSDIVCYLSYLDKISPFAKVSMARVFQNREKKENRLMANVKLSILISDEPGGKGSSFQVDNVPKYRELKNPFYEWKAGTNEEQEEEEIKNEPPKLDIKGILKVGSEFRVIIEEKIYKIGDRVEECTIKSIAEDKLVVEKAGIVYEIPMKEKKDNKN